MPHGTYSPQTGDTPAQYTAAWKFHQWQDFGITNFRSLSKNQLRKIRKYSSKNW